MKNFIHYWLIIPFIIAKQQTFKGHEKYIKYILRYLLHFRINYEWVFYLNSDSEMKRWNTDEYESDSYLKLQQAYMSKSFTFDEKLFNLKSHYQWFFQHVDESHFNKKEVHLLNLVLNNGSDTQDRLVLSFTFKAIFFKEGETNLVLKLNDDIQYILTFSYIIYQGQATFFIGGLQGGRKEVTNLDIIKQLTKELYGLRPKQLMLHALSVLCHIYEVKQMVAISNDTHFYRGSHRPKHRERIKTDLNEFWLEFNATQDKNDHFVFSPLSNQINLEDIASKKRSQYRKRQLILDQLVQQGTQQLAYLKHPEIVNH